MEINLSDVIRYGSKFNEWLSELVTTIGFDSTQSKVLIAIGYMVIIYILLSLGESLKPIVKWGLIALIVYLIIGFF